MKSVYFAQITDIHLLADSQQDYNGINTYLSFQKVIKKVQALPQKPDFLLLTGDLSQDGTPESYQHLKKEIAPTELTPNQSNPKNHRLLSFYHEIPRYD